MVDQFPGAEHNWGPGQGVRVPHDGPLPLDIRNATVHSQARLRGQSNKLRLSLHREAGSAIALGAWAYKERSISHILIATLTVILVAMVFSSFNSGNMLFVAGLMFSTATGAAVPRQSNPSNNVSPIPPPPAPEPVEVIELPLPPVAPSEDVGSCTLEVNPRGTGCIFRELGDYEFQAGDFTPDGKHVIVNLKFVGAPASPDPKSIYTGEQLILVKADGTTFPNGDTWKCLSCGVPESQQQLRDPQLDYPHVFRSGDKALWGHK